MIAEATNERRDTRRIMCLATSRRCLDLETEAIRVLKVERETWRRVCENLANEGPAADPADLRLSLDA